MCILKYPILITLMFSVNLSANERPGAVFLLISPGARAVAMGSAFTGLCDDPSLLYYNPGGLGLYNKFGFLVMNQGLPPGIGRFIEERFLEFAGDIFYKNNSISPEPEWLSGLHPGMHYIYSAGIFPFKKIGNIGLSYTYLSTGITEVISSEGIYLGSYETYDYAVGLSYGTNILKRLGLGITTKYIYSLLVPAWVWEKMPELGIDKGGTGQTIAGDFGVLYKIWGCGIGFSVQNYGPRIKYMETSPGDRLPTRIRWGIVISPVVALDTILTISNYKALPFSISSIIDFKRVYDRSYDPKIPDDIWKSEGWEFIFFRYFSLRYGSFTDSLGWRIGPTEGIGFNLRNIQIDIATDQEIYDFETENWRVQIILNAIKPPEKIKNNSQLHKWLTIASTSLAPGGGQFYKGEGIKGLLFFTPSLYLGNRYFSSHSNTTKTWTLIGLGALYLASAIEALSN